MTNSSRVTDRRSQVDIFLVVRDGCLKLAIVNAIKYIRHIEQNPITAHEEEDKNTI